MIGEESSREAAVKEKDVVLLLKLPKGLAPEEMASLREFVISETACRMSLLFDAWEGGSKAGPCNTWSVCANDIEHSVATANTKC